VAAITALYSSRYRRENVEYLRRTLYSEM